MPTLSIIVPVYNKKPFLRRCFDSIATQQNPEVEVIIIDDGSTDGSDLTCLEYARTYKWFHIRTKNHGVSAARNLGLSHASGEYVAFMDADDAFMPGAIKWMLEATALEQNFYQFGHNRYPQGPSNMPIRRVPPAGRVGLDNIISYISLVWNKMYKKSFLANNQIMFDTSMPFGEDEIFNLRCLLAEKGLYQVAKVVSGHYFDDKNSICRGHMCKEYVQCLYDALQELKSAQTDEKCANMLDMMIKRHYKSNLFIKYRVNDHKEGKYDIVYFLKVGTRNEELRYSLRSVEKYVPHRKVWFYGGKPEGIRPDGYVHCAQREMTKWERVRGMMHQACQNDEITEDFWLFNDDFFILKPLLEDAPAPYDGTLTSKADEVDKRHHGEPGEWTTNLRRLRDLLKENNRPELNYAVHKPLLVNRRKMLAVLDKFPREPMLRALYGNYYELGGVDSPDMKVTGLATKDIDAKMAATDCVSTSDESFRNGQIGKWLRDKFNTESRFEI